MKNLERDRRRKKGAIGSQDGSFRTFERRTRGADGRSATCILEEGWKRSDVLYGKQSIIIVRIFSGSFNIFNICSNLINSNFHPI